MKKDLERKRPQSDDPHRRQAERRAVEVFNEQLQAAVDAIDWSKVELVPEQRQRKPK